MPLGQSNPEHERAYESFGERYNQNAAHRTVLWARLRVAELNIGE
jgi:hypothetical protein